MSASTPEPTRRHTISCPGCEEKYIVEAASIPSGGGALSCRICGGRITLPTSAMVAVQTDAAAPLEGRHRTRENNAAPPASSAVEVTCPRCRHTFDPATSTAIKTILVVEDTEFFLRLVTETLGQRYRTLSARTKADALRILREQKVDLLILDLVLEEDNDGSSVLGAEAAGIPCLIFTAKSEEEMWGEAWNRLREMGASDLLLKGMNIEEQLLKKVAALIAP